MIVVVYENNLHVKLNIAAYLYDGGHLTDNQIIKSMKFFQHLLCSRRVI